MSLKPAASETMVLYLRSSKALVRAFRGSLVLGECVLGQPIPSWTKDEIRRQEKPVWWKEDIVIMRG